MSNPYESEQLLSEYLLFHYGRPEEVLPYDFGPKSALDFHARCAHEAAPSALGGRALDIGCAVGRSSFELARTCESVLGIDYSHRFIQAANELKRSGRLTYRRLEEGLRFTEAVAEVPGGIDRERVTFETGDAINLRSNLGQFDLVLAANLLCRLPDPANFLARLPSLVKPGGRLILTTPCSWMEQYTPREKWLCGEKFTTLEGLHLHLDADFALQRTLDLPFLIREHARKYQWTVSLLSAWRRGEVPTCRFGTPGVSQF